MVLWHVSAVLSNTMFLLFVLYSNKSWLVYLFLEFLNFFSDSFHFNASYILTMWKITLYTVWELSKSTDSRWK